MVVMGYIGRWWLIRMARIAASPTRTPANVPGPTVTPNLSTSCRPTPDDSKISAIIKGSFSVCPRPVSSRRSMMLPSASASATEHACCDVSQARTVGRCCGSGNSASILKGKAWRTFENSRRIALTYITEKVYLYCAVREKSLLNPFWVKA